MNLDKFTQKAQEAILQAQTLAGDLNHQTIEPAHLLLALLVQPDGVVSALVTNISGSTAGMMADLQKDLEARPRSNRPRRW